MQPESPEDFYSLNMNSFRGEFTSFKPLYNMLSARLEYISDIRFCKLVTFCL